MFKKINFSNTKKLLRFINNSLIISFKLDTSQIPEAVQGENTEYIEGKENSICTINHILTKLLCSSKKKKAEHFTSFSVNQ